MFHRKDAIATLALLLLCMAWPVRAASEIELNGWRLQQLFQAVEASMGTPVKVAEQGDEHLRAYMIDERAYMVFGYHKAYPNHVHSVQLTGTTERALAFRGLRLGDPWERVREVLGEPDTRVEVDDPRVTRHEYDDANFSVEIDTEGRLFSIRLHTSAEIVANLPEADNPWPGFKAAVLAGDFAALAEWLRPDVEVYTAGRILSIEGRYRDLVETPDPALLAALLGGDDSVRVALARAEPGQELRMIEKVGIGPVYKFPAGSPLEEIVFLPYAGRYRVYEIAFRDQRPPFVAPSGRTLGLR